MLFINKQLTFWSHTQTRKKPQDLSAREGEERGRVGGGVVYVVSKCEWVG